MNEKELMEKRNDLQAKMEEILNKAKVENRAMNDEEIKNFDNVEKEIKNIKILGNYRIIIFNTKNRIEFILLNPVLTYSLSL